MATGGLHYGMRSLGATHWLTGPVRIMSSDVSRSPSFSLDILSGIVMHFVSFSKMSLCVAVRGVALVAGPNGVVR